jgi:ketosteroid isomerase-like protein
MTTKLELLGRTLEEGFPFDEDIPTALASPDRLARLRQAVEAVGGPDLVVEMVGDHGFRTERLGVDGFVEGWQDWVHPFESFRIVLDGVSEAGDHVLVLVTQIVRPRGTAVEITQDAAAVWSFEGERLKRVGFYLDRDEARSAAGLTD